MERRKKRKDREVTCRGWRKGRAANLDGEDKEPVSFILLMLPGHPTDSLSSVFPRYLLMKPRREAVTQRQQDSLLMAKSQTDG